MAQDMNRTDLIGRIVKDAEVKTVGEAEVVEFSIASTDRVKRDGDWQDYSSYFDCVKWNPGGVVKYLTKGRQIAISGKLRQDRWQTPEGQNRSKVKIHVFDLQLLQQPKGASDPGPDSGAGGGTNYDDEVPF